MVGAAKPGANATIKNEILHPPLANTPSVRIAVPKSTVSHIHIEPHLVSAKQKFQNCYAISKGGTD